MTDEFANYAPSKLPALITKNNFRDKLHASLQHKIQGGVNGIPLGQFHVPPRDEGKAFRAHAMSKDIFELGCQIHERGIPLDPKIWVHWMTDADLIVKEGYVVVYHRSDFYCRNVQFHLERTLKAYFGKKVYFAANPQIEMAVVV